MQVHANCCLTGQILFRATVYVSFSLHVKRIYPGLEIATILVAYAP